jgi:hypothetical protein
MNRPVTEELPALAEHASAASTRVLPAFSVYHEPWWLDAATDRQWSEIVVDDGDASARLRYPLHLANGRMISRMGTLIRTLGPEFSPLPGKPVTALRRKLKLTRSIAEGLSHLDFFEQTFDPRVDDAAGFAREAGFITQVQYSFRVERDVPAEQSWTAMTDKTRNLIRTASSRFRLAETADVDAFCRFHDRCLRGRPNFHGTARMRGLLTEIHAHGAGQILIALNEKGVLAAGIVLVWDHDAVRFWLAAREKTLAGAGVVSLLVWKGIQIAAERGVGFDFDGAQREPVMQFLSGFGGKLVKRLTVTRAANGFLPAPGRGPAR